MAKYQITAPDGGTYEITAPDGASEAEVLAYAKKNLGSPAPAPAGPGGDVPAAQPKKKVSASQDLAEFGSGLVRGARDIPHAIYQMAARGAESVYPSAGTTAFRESVEGAIRNAENNYQSSRTESGIDGGRIIGNIGASLPFAAVVPGGAAPGLMARTAAGATSGAVGSSLTPIQNPENFWAEKGGQAAFGAAGGAIAAPVMGGAARIAQPRASVNPNVQTLMAEGVRPTPGQIAGGPARWMEDKLSSVPFVGDVIRAAQRRPTVELNTAAINRSLEPIGQRLPADLRTGREAVDFAHTTISNAYSDLLPQLNVAVDQRFGQEMNNVITGARGLPNNVGPQLETLLRERVLSRFNNGQMTGQAMKEIESELGTLARDYSRSNIASERQMGAGLRATQQALRDLVERSNPGHVGELQSINRAFANLARVERAAGSAGAVEGTFSAPQLSNAVRMEDPSRRRNAFARGNAMMQDLSDAGRAVLPSTVPDSGTAPRLMTGSLMLGAPAYVDPLIGSTLAASSLAYTPWGQNLMAHLLANRGTGQVAGAVSRGLLGASPYVAMGAAPAAQGLLGP